MTEGRRRVEIEPGDVYGNRLGHYEVLVVDVASGKINVRYLETGKLAELNIETQFRIWDNMVADERLSIRKANAATRKYQTGYGADFSGLAESDFKTNVESTTWRSRRALGGEVARLLSVGGPRVFTSWAIYGWPVVFLTHRENYQMAAFDEGSRKAKFTIELDANCAFFGFYVERRDGVMGSDWDWPRFAKRLRQDQHLQDVIRTAEDRHACRFVGRAAGGPDTFHFADGLSRGAHPLWSEEDPGIQTVSDRLIELERVPEDQWVEVYIISKMPKLAAIEAGTGVAEHISMVLRALFPIYDAAVGDS